MSSPAEMAQRHAAILARLADVGERLAMKHAQRALEADDPGVEAQATAAFHRAARSVRQCLALEAKLVRDARRADREDRDDAADQAATRRDRRRSHARAAVERLIWTETEDPVEAERLEAELEDLLDLEQFADGLADEAPEAHIARLCRELGLAPPDQSAPAEPAIAAPRVGPAAPDWRSSA